MRILREQRLKRGERRRSARREREEERGKINACTHTIVQAVPLPDTPKMKSGKENPNCGEEYLQYDPVSEREGSLGHVAKTLRDVFISGDVTRGNFLATSFATKLRDGARKNLPGVKRLILIIVSRWYNSATPNHSKMLLRTTRCTMFSFYPAQIKITFISLVSVRNRLHYECFWLQEWILSTHY